MPRSMTRGEQEREETAARFRDWIHEQPELTKCSMGADECPDWPLAFELADIALDRNRLE